ncbi:MAG: hypothetical protein ACPG5T_05830 [Endozoicomonas sp.]
MRNLLTLAVIMIRIAFFGDKMPFGNPYSEADAIHPERPRRSRKHQIKRSWVKSIWIAAGLLMLLNPVLPITLIIALPTTFLSFMILDETS